MTRINLVPVEELADQHLMAEYRELPRMAAFATKTVKKLSDIPKKFTLNAGHMTFFLNKGTYLEERHKEIVDELKRRGYKLSIEEPFEMNRRFRQDDTWEPTVEEIETSRERIREKLEMKPSFYRWSRKP